MTEFESEWRERLAVAVATVEAFVDGKLDPTPRRLRAVLESLSAIEALLTDVSVITPGSTEAVSLVYVGPSDRRA